MADLAKQMMLEDTVNAGPRLLEPRPLVTDSRQWARWVGSVLSLAVLAAVFWQLRGLDIAHIAALIPPAPSFWIAFALYYLAGPFADWVIFRRLWQIPASGIGALLRKFVSNELILGYLGELYFYTWARRQGRMTAAPFGAIKDVAILSAIAGNALTLAMLALAFPLVGWLDLGVHGKAIYGSAAIVMAVSLAMMLLRGRLFSLPREELRFIFMVHLARLVAANMLLGAMWHLALPSVALGWWLLLSTARLLISRLPLLPNREIVFAGLAILLVGHDPAIADLMALIAGLVLFAHLLVGGVLGFSGLVRPGGGL